MLRHLWRAIVLLLVVAVLAAPSVLLGGCKQQSIDVPPVTADKPAPAKAPKPADLTTPEKAVTSYLAFVTYAYRLGNSDVASQTMGPEELVRVDSYIQLDRERGRKIDQHLDSIKFGSPVAQGPSTKLVPAQEAWTYRYIDNVSGTFSGAAKKASFTATYTVEQGPKGWLVTSVEATSSTPVQ